MSPPFWDLDVVFRSLRLPPLEPLASATFRDLAKRTLFLVFLTLAKRVSELRALSARVASIGGDLSLPCLPGLVVKTESDSNPLPRSFLLKSLKDFVGDLEDEFLLCPVWDLKFYLQATRDLSPRPVNLFVSPRCRQRALSKYALSFFLRETISCVGSLGDFVGPSPRAHSIRGVGISLVFHWNWAVKEALKAATWRSNSVFVSFFS